MSKRVEAIHASTGSARTASTRLNCGFMFNLAPIMLDSIVLSHKTGISMIKNSLIILALAIVFFTPSHAEQKFQSHDSIYELVKDTVARNINTSAEYEISVLPLDSQLKLPECTEALEAFTAADSIKAGRTSIGVRCNAEKKWSISTSAVIKIYESVIVLSRPVERGDLITSQHLAIEKRDVSKLRGDFVTQTEQVENKQATRYLPAGAILGLKSVTEPRVIKRGDKVIISTTQPAFAIRMNGAAMMDGSKGQRIKVKNENSGRIISATVIEAGLVAVK
jgi:flagella basal body P-ring formation protein FlgA